MRRKAMEQRTPGRDIEEEREGEGGKIGNHWKEKKRGTKTLII